MAIEIKIVLDEVSEVEEILEAILEILANRDDGDAGGVVTTENGEPLELE